MGQETGTTERIAETRRIRIGISNYSRTVCASVGSANNMNKLSLVGMQLPEKYKENFDVSSEGTSSGVRDRS